MAMIRMLRLTLLSVVAIVLSACIAHQPPAVVNNGAIRKLEIPGGWTQESLTGNRAPREQLIKYKGPFPESYLAIRQIRRPGRAQSRALKKLLKASPHHLNQDELRLVSEIANTPSIEIRGWSSSITEGRTLTINSRTVVEAVRSNSWSGGCRSGEPTTAHRVRIVLADIDGTGALVQEIAIGAETKDVQAVDAQVSPYIERIKWN